MTCSHYRQSSNLDQLSTLRGISHSLIILSFVSWNFHNVILHIHTIIIMSGYLGFLASWINNTGTIKTLICFIREFQQVSPFGDYRLVHFFFFYLVILFCEEWFLYKDKAYSILRVSLKCNESHQQSLIVCKHGDTKGALISTLLTNTPSPPLPNIYYIMGFMRSKIWRIPQNCIDELWEFYNASLHGTGYNLMIYLM